MALFKGKSMRKIRFRILQTHIGLYVRCNLLNHEICCDFTHMLVTDGLDLDSSTAPFCGDI